jgi:hypothetical protein
MAGLESVADLPKVGPELQRVGGLSSADYIVFQHFRTHLVYGLATINSPTKYPTIIVRHHLRDFAAFLSTALNGFFQDGHGQDGRLQGRQRCISPYQLSRIG